MSRAVVSLLLLALCAGAVAEQIDIQLHIPIDDTGVDISHPLRVSSRQEDPLENDLADRANLLFRALDQDRDRLVSAQDARASVNQLALHMPGVNAEEFVSFIDTADKNGDHMLNREELLQGLADGLAVQEEPQQAPTLMETRCSCGQRPWHF